MSRRLQAYSDALQRCGAEVAAVLTHDGTVVGQSARCPSLSQITAKTLRTLFYVKIGATEHPLLCRTRMPGMDRLLFGQSTTGDEYSWAIYITKNYIAIAGSTSEKTPTGTAAKVLAVVQQLVE